MLAELSAVLANVPQASGAADYREAILQRNVLGKTTDSTRRESLRRLRELYALDEATPIFGLLRKLQAIDTASLPLLAVQVAWARDPLLRATTPPVIDASEGERVETASLAQAFEAAFPNQYSELSRNQTARHAASSWTQSGHLAGRAKKVRQQIKPTAVVVTMAFFLGDVAGYHESVVEVSNDNIVTLFTPRSYSSSRAWCVKVHCDELEITDIPQGSCPLRLKVLKRYGPDVQLGEITKWEDRFQPAASLTFAKGDTALRAIVFSQRFITGFGGKQ